MIKVLQLIAPQMRAPGPGIGGWLAQKLMEKGNPPSIQAGIQRLDLQQSDVFVELGGGHGVGLREASKSCPQRIVVVEISPAFRDKLETVKAELENSSAVEIYGEDAKSMPFLKDNSVDKMFAMNVVYFLDPLDVYLKEIHRVLKPNGQIVFGCKFGAVKEARFPFVNTEPEPIVDHMQKAGFEVSSQKVELETPMYSYVEVKGVKTPEQS